MNLIESGALAEIEPKRLDISIDQLQSIFAETNAQIIDDPARHFLYRKGQSVNELNILLEGWVIKYDLLSDGTRQIFQVCVPGDMVGASNLYRSTRNDFARTITPVKRLAIDRAKFLELARSSIKLGAELVRTLIKATARLENTVTDLGRRSAMERISRLLLYLAARTGYTDKEALGQMPFPLTQNQIADATGLTPVHVNRTLRQLRKSEIVYVNHGHLEVRNWELLLEAAGMTEMEFKSLS